MCEQSLKGNIQIEIQENQENGLTYQFRAISVPVPLPLSGTYVIFIVVQLFWYWNFDQCTLLGDAFIQDLKKVMNFKIIAYF